MATKPSTLPVWATDATFASGSQSGLSTVLEPPFGYKQQGCVSGRSAPARYFNWLLNLIYTWVVYLDDLHNSVQFLNKAYSWTGNQTFGGTLTQFNGTTEFNGTFTRLMPGVELSYSAARTRTITVPWLSGAGQNSYSSGTAPDGPTTGTISGVMNVVRNGTLTGSGSSSFAVVLPQGAVLTGWQVLCKATQGNFNFQFELYKATHDFSTPAYGASTQVGATQSQSGTSGSTYVKGQSGLSETVNAGTQYWIEVAILTVPAPPNEMELELASVQLTYTETRASGSH